MDTKDIKVYSRKLGRKFASWSLDEYGVSYADDVRCPLVDDIPEECLFLTKKEIHLNINSHASLVSEFWRGYNAYMKKFRDRYNADRPTQGVRDGTETPPKIERRAQMKFGIQPLGNIDGVYACRFATLDSAREQAFKLCEAHRVTVIVFEIIGEYATQTVWGEAQF